MIGTVLPIWAFVAVTVPFVLTPGASTALVFRNSVGGGVRAGIETAVGVNAGSCFYGLLSACGVAFALHQWPSAWMVFRVAGILYLAWLGLRSMWHAVASESGLMASGATAGGRSVADHVYEGFVTNVLNPAIATFYLIILPQFIPRGAPVVRSVLILTAVHVSIAASWHVVWATAGGTLARTLGRGRPRQILEFCAGTALLLLAIRLALK